MKRLLRQCCKEKALSWKWKHKLNNESFAPSVEGRVSRQNNEIQKPQSKKFLIILEELKKGLTFTVWWAMIRKIAFVLRAMRGHGKILDT